MCRSLAIAVFEILGILALAVAVKQPFAYFSAFLNVQTNKKMVDGVCFIKARRARATCVTSVFFLARLESSIVF